MAKAKQEGIRNIDYVFQVAKRTLNASPYVEVEGKVEVDSRDVLCRQQKIDFYKNYGSNLHIDIKKNLHGFRIKTPGDLKISNRGHLCTLPPLGFEYVGSVAFLHYKTSGEYTHLDHDKMKIINWDDYNPKDRVGLFISLGNLKELDVEYPKTGLNRYLAEEIAKEYSSVDKNVEFSDFMDLLFFDKGPFYFFESEFALEDDVLKGYPHGSSPINTKKLEERINNTIEAAHKFFSIVGFNEFRMYNAINSYTKDSAINLITHQKLSNSHKPIQEDLKEEIPRLLSMILGKLGINYRDFSLSESSLRGYGINVVRDSK